MANSIQTVGVMGGGLIGASWTTLFLANGFDVRVTDINADSENYIREFIDKAWDNMQALGLKPGADPKRWSFSTDNKILADAQFVQENGPENAKIKRAMIGGLNDVLASDAIIASSSSGILVDDIADASNHPERVVIGHPFNPPHIVPLVEIVGGKDTTDAVKTRTREFYTAAGKHPIVLNKAVPGHIANRFQAALMRESLYLLHEGVASADDIDAAISQGVGLRYALMGQLMTVDLAGGKGGVEHAIELLGPALDVWFGSLSNLSEYPESLRAETVEKVGDMMKSYDREAIEAARDRMLLEILKGKAKEKALP